VNTLAFFARFGFGVVDEPVVRVDGVAIVAVRLRCCRGRADRAWYRRRALLRT
jgi:hypothetical protein